MASQSDLAAAEAEFQKKYGGMGGGMRPRMGPGGGMGRPGGNKTNSVLLKRLQGGGQKWFDSGDYNMNKNNKAQPNIPSPIYKAPASSSSAAATASSNGAGEGSTQQQQCNLPNPAFKQPNIPTANQNQAHGITSPTKSKLAD